MRDQRGLSLPGDRVDNTRTEFRGNSEWAMGQSGKRVKLRDDRGLTARGRQVYQRPEITVLVPAIQEGVNKGGGDRWSLQVLGKVALGATTVTTHINGSTTTTETTTGTTTTYPGGVLAQATNPGNEQSLFAASVFSTPTQFANLLRASERVHGAGIAMPRKL